MERAKTNVLNWLSQPTKLSQILFQLLQIGSFRAIPLVVIPEDGYKLEATHRWATRL